MPAYITIYVKTKTIAMPGQGLRPDLSEKLLKQTIRTIHAYSDDLSQAITRVEIQNSKIGAFRSEMQKQNGPIAEIIPSDVDKINHRQLLHIMDPKNNRDPFDLDAGR